MPRLPAMQSSSIVRYVFYADLLQGQPWWNPFASFPAAIASLPYASSCRGLLRPLHQSDGLTTTLRQAFAGSDQPYERSTNRQDALYCCQKYCCSCLDSCVVCRSNALTLSSDHLEVSLLIPAFENDNEWQMTTPRAKHDMKRGNRPVAFYANKAAQKNEYGYLNTNRAFLYGTVTGRTASGSASALHPAFCIHRNEAQCC